MPTQDFKHWLDPTRYPSERLNCGIGLHTRIRPLWFSGEEALMHGKNAVRVRLERRQDSVQVGGVSYFFVNTVVRYSSKSRDECVDQSHCLDF
jgi:hypothetical protein